MAKYRLTDSDVVVRTLDGAIIPNDIMNSDRQEYVQWIKAGNQPDAFVIDPMITQRKDRQTILDAHATRTDLLDKLQSLTPQQISQYVDNNVTTIAEARALFKRILLVLARI